MMTESHERVVFWGIRLGYLHENSLSPTRADISWHLAMASIKYFAALLAFASFVLGFAFGRPQISSLSCSCSTYSAHPRGDLKDRSF